MGGEKTLYNFDKIRDHARLHGLAAARLTDYIKINAIFSDPAFINGDIYTIPLNVGVNTGLNEEICLSNCLFRKPRDGCA